MITISRIKAKMTTTMAMAQGGKLLSVVVGVTEDKPWERQKETFRDKSIYCIY